METFVIAPDNTTYKELEDEAIEAFMLERLQEWQKERNRLVGILSTAAGEMMKAAKEILKDGRELRETSEKSG